MCAQSYCKKASVDASKKMEQQCIIKFLTIKGSKLADIHRRLKVQLGNDALLKTYKCMSYIRIHTQP